MLDATEKYLHEFTYYRSVTMSMQNVKT